MTPAEVRAMTLPEYRVFLSEMDRALKQAEKDRARGR